MATTRIVVCDACGKDLQGKPVYHLLFGLAGTVERPLAPHYDVCDAECAIVCLRPIPPYTVNDRRQTIICPSTYKVNDGNSVVRCTLPAGHATTEMHQAFIRIPDPLARHYPGITYTWP